MNFFVRFFQAFFSGADPVAIAMWVRGLVWGVVIASGNGVIDVLTQLSGQLNGPGVVIISWKLVGRTIAIAVIPAVILYVKKSQGATQDEVAHLIRVAQGLPEGTPVSEVKAVASTLRGNQ